MVATLTTPCLPDPPGTCKQMILQQMCKSVEIIGMRKHVYINICIIYVSTIVRARTWLEI